uniref:Putative secreted protein n=2 Tax=Ixodes TaxID=6944 RepID=A0A4D5RCN2_IXOSC
MKRATSRSRLTLLVNLLERSGSSSPSWKPTRKATKSISTSRIHWITFACVWSRPMQTDHHMQASLCEVQAWNLSTYDVSSPHSGKSA